MVAFLGPDGAGKGTVIAGVRDALDGPVTVLYLGRPRGRRNARRKPPSGAAPEGAAPARKRPGAARECAFLVRRAARHLRLLARGYALARRGHAVLCDRHPIEALAVRPPRTRPGAVLERFIARRVIPWPDAVIVLDAPASLLFERKAEHPLEVLERWRGDYLEVFGPRAAVVSTETTSEKSVAAALAAVEQARATARA